MSNIERRPNLHGRQRTIDGFVRGAGQPVVGHQPQVRPIRGTIRPQTTTPKNLKPGLKPSLPVSHPQTSTNKKIKLSMALPETSAQPYKGPYGYRPKLRKIRTWALRAAMVSLSLVIIAGATLYARINANMHHVFRGGKTAAALQKNVDPTKLKGEGDGRINVLLLGIGGGTHDAPDLTDTIMIASIDPVNKKASLLSIPRDMWVTIPGHGSMKLNAAYETGKYAYLGKQDQSNANTDAVKAGFAQSDQLIEQVTGLTIHYNVLVDFHAFQQAVDTLGGVTVNVPEDLYDPTMAWENNWDPMLAKAGVQNFDGKHALIYARSRETSSDFARGARQRALIIAIKEKATTLGTLSNPVKITQLMNAFGDNVQTDFSMNDMVKLYGLTKGIASDQISSLGLTDPGHVLVTTGNIKGQSVVMPKAGIGQYADIQSYVRSQLPDGYLVKENAPVTVLNGTVNEGLALTKANELKSYGYNVIGTGNAPTKNYPNTVVVDLTGGKDKYTAHYLEQRFNTKVVTKLPDSTIQPGTAHFVVILGDNETTTN